MKSKYCFDAVHVFCSVSVYSVYGYISGHQRDNLCHQNGVKDFGEFKNREAKQLLTISFYSYYLQGMSGIRVLRKKLGGGILLNVTGVTGFFGK